MLTELCQEKALDFIHILGPTGHHTGWARAGQALLLGYRPRSRQGLEAPGWAAKGRWKRPDLGYMRPGSPLEAGLGFRWCPSKLSIMLPPVSLRRLPNDLRSSCLAGV